MKRNDKSTKRYIMYAVLIVFLLFGIPILINETYNIGGYATNWGANDVLSFYGSVLGGFSALMVIFITIRHENKKRRYEEQKQKYDTKLSQLRSSLYQALQTLDAVNITIVDVDIENPEPIVNSLKRYAIEINRITLIELLFDSEQKNLLATAIEKLSSYAKEYYALVNRLSDIYGGFSEANLFRSYTRLLDFLTQDYIANRDEIIQINNEVARLNYTDFHSVQSDAFEARKKAVELFNEKYPDVQEAINAGVVALERKR